MARWCLATLWCLLFVNTFLRTASLVRYNKLVCKDYEPSLTHFEYCHLKAINRNTKELYIKSVSVDLPWYNISLTMRVYKKSNGYQPIINEIRIDACQYLKKKNNFILNQIYKVLSKNSNLNHTCPYDHDFIIETKSLQSEVDAFSWIPFASGDYALFAAFYNQQQKRFGLDLYMTIESK